MKMELHVGVIPAFFLWEFYSHYKIIIEQTKEILNKEQEGDEWKNKFLPVIIARLPDYPMIRAPKQLAEEDIKPVKKSIQID